MRKPDVTRLLSNVSRGTGRCERCEGEVPILSTQGHVYTARVCPSCLTVIEREARQARESQRLVAWIERSALPLEGMRSAVAKKVPVHPRLAQLDRLAAMNAAHAAYLTGETGTGKTASTLAYAYSLARERLDHDLSAPLPSVCYMTEEQAHVALARDAGATRERLTRVELLILDEVGVARSSSSGAARFVDALCARLDAGSERRLTILCSNLAPHELCDLPAWPVQLLERLLLALAHDVIILPFTSTHRAAAIDERRARALALLNASGASHDA